MVMPRGGEGFKQGNVRSHAVSEFETIVYETELGVCRVTLNRPAKLNAISARMQEELHDALWLADGDPAVHVVVLKGAGRAFSAGYDLAPPNGRERSGDAADHRLSLREDVARLERAQRLRMVLWDMHKPVLAQVHGYCLAGGTDLALLADITLVSNDAMIGFPPVRAMGSPTQHMWTYLAGPQWSKYMLLTGDTITGKKAEEIGLVWRSVPLEDLEEQVENLARRLVMVDVDLLAANKRICQMALELMGARTLQRMAAEMDARGHQAPAAREFARIASENGLKAAIEWRDGRFRPSAGR